MTEPAAVAAANKRRTLIAAVAIGAVFVVGAGAVAATNGSDEDQANLAAAVSASPSAASASPAVAPKPKPKPTPKPKKAANAATANAPSDTSIGQAPSTPRGVGMSREDAQAAGLVANRIKVFDYRGRLVVLWDMNPLAPEVTRFDLYSVDKSGGGQLYDGTELVGKAGRYGHVFRAGVAGTRCVQIAYVVSNGPPLSDKRTTCPTKPDPKELDTDYAEAAAAHQGIQFAPPPKETARPT
jgi:hypothetical protein